MRGINDLGFVYELQTANESEIANYDVKNYFREIILEAAYKMFEDPKMKERWFDWDFLTSWEKICCAKLTANALNFDCDAAHRSVIIYERAFPHVKKNGRRIALKSDSIYEYCLRSDTEDVFDYIGDTMNSYATTVHEFLKICNAGTSKEGEKLGEGKYAPIKYDKISNKNRWEAFILDNYDHFDKILVEKIPGADNFFRLYHTVGNFIPVPCNFNSPRYSKTKDYWDITLRGIWKWYTCENKEKKNEEGEKVLGEIIDVGEEYKNVQVCESWLRVFGDGADGWNNFVEKNYLQDFVGKKEKGNYGMPKELWEGHFGGNVKPKDKDEFSQFFTNASEWILVRGKAIAEELKKQLKDKSAEEIVGELLGGDNDKGGNKNA